MPEKGWQRRFDDPIPLPDGGELVTLEDAGHLHHEASESGARSAGSDIFRY